MALLEQGAPHVGVILLVLAPGAEQARVAAKGLVTAVAGDLAEGIVDINDGALRVRDHDAFAGMGEHAGSQMKLFLSLLALRDVAHGHVNG